MTPDDDLPLTDDDIAADAAEAAEEMITPEELSEGEDFDFSTTEMADGPVTMKVADPNTGQILTRRGKPLTVQVWGPDTPRMKAFEASIGDKRVRAVQTTGKLLNSAASIERERLQRVVHCIAGWENFAEGGKDVPYSPAAVKRFAEKYPWFRDQVDTFYVSRNNFFREQ